MSRQERNETNKQRLVVREERELAALRFQVAKLEDQLAKARFQISELPHTIAKLEAQRNVTGQLVDQSSEALDRLRAMPADIIPGAEPDDQSPPSNPV